MANPRQRRKARSSAHKTISHSKRAKRFQKKMPAIRGPKALQDMWDPSKTIRQNYLALGLQHDLNPISSGGSEIDPGRNIDTRQPGQTTSSSKINDTRSRVSEDPTADPALPKGFGRIVRDSSGNAVSIELPRDDGTGHASKQKLAIDVPVVMAESELRIWAHDHPEMLPGAGSRGARDMVVQDLENLAASATVQERHTSLGERLYLERLVSKYGDDLHGMARDRRLNPVQRTANELKRAISKAGGSGALCRGMVTGVTE